MDYNKKHVLTAEQYEKERKRQTTRKKINSIFVEKGAHPNPNKFKFIFNEKTEDVKHHKDQRVISPTYDTSGNILSGYSAIFM